MKVKDLERTANIAWSPSSQHPILLAAGTAAQQLDASFNTNAALEIYSLNLSEPGLDMEPKSTTSADQRFHKIVWGAYGRDQPSGTIVGGCDGGIIQIYNAAKLLRGENGLVAQQDKHTGPVHAIDFNPFQSNLLATGAGESEIYIWDLNNTNTPMTPGAKSQPFEDVLCIAWNRQVQHILASTFPSKCVVWDLRKNEPIIKLTDTVSRIRWKVVAWHPEVATQLCLASEEDQAPVVQLWDLRFATSPLKTLENHQRGILSMAWCAQDSNLLVSCGKDNRIICWNPNSNNQGGEVLSEVAKTNQWNFDVAWCPRNPALIACPSFDGHVSIYSLMGGKTQQVQTSNKIADSFPGMDGYVQAPVPQQSTPVSVDLSKPPKWLKRPVGASFGFGGKLISFINDNSQAVQSQQNAPVDQVAAPVIRTVFMSQVITEPELVNQSAQLEQALEYGNFTEYCRNKADSLSDQHKRNIWYFLKANFEENPRAELLNLLGYRIEDVNNKLNEFIGPGMKNDVDGLSDQLSNLNRSDYSDGENNYSSKGSPDLSPGSYDNSLVLDQLSNLSQNIEAKKYYKIKTTDDNEGLITQALLLGNVEAAVELCLKAQRYADAIIIAMTGGSELLARTQYKYLQQSDGYVSSIIAALVSEDWSSVINNCDINSWKEALVATLTHSSDEDLPKLCELLGKRLEEEGQINPKLALDAQLCYICAGNFEKLVDSWSSSVKKSSEDLQELVELVTFLQKAVERQGRSVEITGSLADLLAYYASILASQGNLTMALTYLGNSQNEQVIGLRERLCVSLGYKTAYGQVQQRSRHSSRQSFSSYPAPLNPVTQFTPVSQPTPSFNQFNTGLPNAAANQPWQQQQPTQVFNQAPPPKPFSPPPPSQPPRPTSVGSAHGGSGITSRAKYVVDPSVQSGGPYGTRNQYSASPYMPSNIPLNPTPLPSSVSNQVPMMPALPPQPTPPVFQNQAVSGIVDKAEPAIPGIPGARLANFPPPLSAPGWNDPPVVSKTTSSRHPPKPDYAQPDPITHPLYGTVPSQNIPPSNGFMDPTQQFTPNTPYGQNMPPNSPQIFQPPTSGGFNQPPTSGGFNQPPTSGGFNQPPTSGGFNQPPTSGGFNQPTSFNTQAIGGFNQNAMGSSNFQQPPPPQPTPPVAQVAPEKPQPIQKPPIPDEHKSIQTVFEELRNHCSCTANNPQTKRKLEDVARKLESLYDLLREQKLSPNTLSALHQLVQLVQAGDYTSCLSLHTQLVSGPDFAQIASFMPGLKVLIQCALQLQVYLR